MNFQNLSFFLADQFLKGIAVLVLAGLASRVFRNASAAKRNAIWLSAFAALLLLPLTGFVSPEWRWNPFARPQETSLLEPSTSSVRDTGFSQLEFSPVPTRVVSSEQRWQWPDWKTTLMIIWCTGAGLTLLRRTIGSVQLHRLLRRSEPVSSGIVHETLSELLEVHSLSRPVRLRISPLCQVPVTWGVLRPVILLPEDAEKWSAERIRMVLAHELGHILRWDSAVRTLAHLCCAFHWFNPLVWVASHGLRLTQELACDDLVLRDEIDPAEYAAELVETVRRVQSPSPVFCEALAMAQPSTLETRVLAVMNEHRDRSSVGRWSILASAVTVPLLLAGSALAQVAPIDRPVSPSRGTAAPAGNVPGRLAVTDVSTREWRFPLLAASKLAPAAKWESNDRGQGAMKALLEARGVSFPLGTSMRYSTDTGTLVVRNTRANLDRVDQILNDPAAQLSAAEREALAAHRAAIDPTYPILKKAEKLIIPKLELREATLQDAIAFLVEKSRELDPEKTGIKITISPDIGKITANAVINPTQARITVALRNIPFSEAIRYLTGLVGATFSSTSEGYLVTARAEARDPQIEPEVLPNTAEVPVAANNAMSTKEWRVPAFIFRDKNAPNSVDGRVDIKRALTAEGVIFLPGSSVIWLPSSSKLSVRNTRENLDLVDQFVQRAVASVPPAEWANAIATAEKEYKARTFPKNDSGIVIPTLEIRNLSLEDAVKLLMAKALEADSKKQGVKITIGNAPEKDLGASAKATPDTASISLRDIPLEEALVYVAGFFNRKVEKTPEGFRLIPHPATSIPK